MEYKVNKYQTELTEELIKSLTREEKIEVFKYIDGVPFIRNLMSDQRRYIKDMPKTEDGRVIPDLEDPHILEDTNYFRQPAIHFQEHGCYTNLYPNNHPNSEYKKFWQEEAQKCREGAVRETDGEWIPGYFYYYLNYSPIMKVTPVEGRQAHREHDFPDFYDGDYFYFHYIEQARQAGMHGSILKRRGVGASFKGAAMLGRNTVLGELAFTAKKRNSTNSFAVANEKEYLTKDGILNKYIDNLDWCSDTTPWPRMKIKNSLNDMSWKAGYIDKETGVERGSGNQVLGVTLKNDPQKARGKRGQLILWEESGKFSGLLTAWNIARESIEEGRFTFGTMLNFGTGGSEGADFTALEEMFYNPYGYNIYALNNVYDLNMEEGAKCSFFWGAYLNRKGYYDENGNSDVVGSLIEVIKDRIHVKNNSNDPNAVTQRKSENPIIPQEAILRVGQSIFPVSDVREALSTIKSDLGRFTNSHYTGEFTMGLDGHPLWKNKDLTPIREFPVADPKNKQGAVEIFHQPIKNHEGRVTPGRYIAGCLTPGEKVMTDKGLKTVEDVTLDDMLINEKGDLVSINNLQKYYLKDEITYKLKVSNTYRTTNFTSEHPILVSSPTLGYVGKKRCKEENIKQRYLKFDFKYITVDKVKTGDWIKVPNVYKKTNSFDINTLWKDSGHRMDRLINSPLEQEDFWWFVGLWLGDGWCNSNGDTISISLNKLETSYKSRLKHIVNNLFGRQLSYRERSGSVECTFSFQQLSTFLTTNFGKYSYGKKIPEWGKKIDSSLKLQLLSGYLSSDGSVSQSKTGYYSMNFVSINLELLESIQDISFSIGLISNLNKLRNATEHKIRDKISKTAICYTLRFGTNDVVKFKTLLHKKENLKLDKVDTGVLKSIRDKRPNDGCFFDDSLDYIYFKIKGIELNNYTGFVHNFECLTHTFMCHHITTHNCDTYDDDHSSTTSLGSIFIYDLFTERIVAEYTGRPRKADDFYEICRRLLLHYNAKANYENDKKGLYGYFYNKNCTHLLCDNPEILEEKNLAKVSHNYGNKKKGTNSSTAINAWARQLQADWLIEDAWGTGGVDEDGSQISPILNVYMVRSVAYLEEISKWNIDGNFDRVSSMGMLMIYRQEVKKFIESSKQQRHKTITDDPFFNRHMSRNNKTDMGKKLYDKHVFDMN